MFDFHKDKKRYFDIQVTVTLEEIIPFIGKYKSIDDNSRVLEVGCGEAGVLKAFLQQGCTGVGVELAESRVKDAQHFLSKEINDGKARIVNENIYDSVQSKSLGHFDIIILKDVIEHIPDQMRFIDTLHALLKDDGVIFFAYPPWWMPFGGHQQIASSKYLRAWPWLHLAPKKLYHSILRWCNEKPATIHELMDVYATGINIETMYRILKIHHFTIIDEVFWFFNPIYKFKFGLRQRKVWPILTRIPLLRNFYTTAHYIIFKKTIV
ncbi:MAG: class I SAM-dependent methyltransferase [Saprospiraceae bacterium]